jgi:hypothetical protein
MKRTATVTLFLLVLSIAAMASDSALAGAAHSRLVLIAGPSGEGTVGYVSDSSDFRSSREPEKCHRRNVPEPENLLVFGTGLVLSFGWLKRRIGF